MNVSKKLLILFFGILKLTYGQDEILIDSIISSSMGSELKTLKIQNLLKEKKDHLNLTYKVSIAFYRKKLYDQAIIFGEQHLELIQKEKSLDTLAYRKSLNNLGFLYFKKGMYDIGKPKYLKILKQNKTDIYNGKAYYGLGTLYQHEEDYYKAFDYYQKAHQFYKLLDYKNGIFNSAIKISSICNLLSNKELTKKGITLLENLIQSDLVIPRFHLLAMHKSLGNLYNDGTTNYQEQSILNYSKALEIAKRSKNQSQIIGLHNNIGNASLIYDLEQAKYHLQEGLKIAKKGNQKGMLTHNLAIYHFKNNAISEAIQSLKQSIQHYLNTTTPLHEISIKDFESSVYKTYILDAFVYLIEYQNQDKTSQEDLDSIYAHIHIADQLVDYIRFEIEDQQSRLYWQEQASKLYQHAVKTSFLAQNPEKAFHYMEKNKAILLLEDITDRELKKNANLPQPILNREKKLKDGIYANMDVYIATKKSKKDSVADLMNASKIVYHNFIDSLKTDYPQYYHYKTPLPLISFKQVQSSLQKDEVIIEYILNNINGYGIFIDQSETKFFELKNVSQLHKNIIKFRTKIESPFVTKKEIEDYNTIAYQIYQTLFSFKNATAYLKNKKITIVPDDNLQNLPFEALITNSKTKSYLISSTEINYAYSISFLKENQKIERSHTIDYSAFAPVHFDYDGLSSLKNSLQEVKESEKCFSGDLYLNNDATKDNFIKNTTHSKVIHLSTHANATDSITPWIAFKNSKLTLNELYTTKNNAELVVLSACNSAQGKLNRGEGVMSLARGFFYAGANSVISSLWNVDDKAGQYITTHFYKCYKAGKTKSEALRLAKLSYLKNHSLSELSPYYWSSLILIGDPSTLDITNNYWIWYTTTGAISLFGIFFFWYRKRK